MAKQDLESRTFDCGQPLFLEGDSGDCGYLITEGKVAIYKKTQGCKDVLIAELGRGEIVGEMALIDNAPRGATARALEATKVTVISRDHYEARVRNANPMVRMLLTALVTRLRRTNYVAVNAPTEGWRPL